MQRAAWLHVCLVFFVSLILPSFARAHVGSPNVFFEGKAGPYPVHVVIKPAEVIPGLAEISVRLEGSVDRVTALPIKWNAGRKGAPPPDVATPVRGETNLFHAQLWFMEGGSQSVELEITGASGTGRVTIPVDAVARRVLTMPHGLGTLLVVLGSLLVVLLVSVIGAAVREGIVEPGLAPDRRRRIRGALATGLTAILVCLLLLGGKHWWDIEANDYRNNRLYRPIEAGAHVRTEQNQRILRIEITDPRFQYSAPFVPDHGKLMHLFLMREPKLDGFAHLHPVKLNRSTFETPLPDLPAGRYQMYADITYETGFSDTLTNLVEIPALPINAEATNVNLKPDLDDSWKIGPEFSTRPISPAETSFQLNDRFHMTWLAPKEIVVNRPMELRFLVTDRDGKSAPLQPYLGMKGHLALRRDDGSVFTHLHPGGSASMAAMQLSVLRVEGKLPLKAGFGLEDPICELPGLSAADQAWIGGFEKPGEVTFPYAFPRPGRYRLWVQVKIESEILTGIFDVEAQPSATKSGALALLPAL